MIDGNIASENVTLVMQIIKEDGVQSLKFTNLPMTRVKDAIDLLNDDHVELIQPPRTEDFTSRELFGNQIGEERHGETIKVCLECGSLVTNHGKHTTWHNKLIP